MLIRALHFLKRRFIVLSALVTWLFCAVIFLCDYAVVSGAEEYLYDDASIIPHNRVGLLLGTSKYTSNNNQNQYFNNRIQAAAALFHAKKIDYILISGDNSFTYYNEPQMMLEDLIKLQVPREKIYLDYAGFRTLDSVIRAKKIFGLNQLTVISQKFHNERAIFIARKNGIDAVGFNAKDVDKFFGFKTKIREKFARVKVVIDLLAGKEPKFLGEPIEIN
jgi:SanA protein